MIHRFPSPDAVIPPQALPPPANPHGTSVLYYTLRVSVHNGRTFVGPPYELVHLLHLNVPEWKLLQVRSQPICSTSRLLDLSGR